MGGERDPLHGFKTGYLKYRTALWDRNTSLVAWPVLLDDIRRHFEEHERLVLVAAQFEELERMEAIYGWQSCDRLINIASATVRRFMSDGHGEGALVGQDGVHLGRFVAFLCGEPRFGVMDAAREADALRRALEEAFAGPEFAGLQPGVRFHCGYALLEESPLMRFERLVAAAVSAALPVTRPARTREGESEREMRRVLRECRVHMLYQPVVRLDDGRTVGFEALARGPQGSPLETPAVLFAVAERLGLEADLDRLCRRRALAETPGPGARGDLFVNVRPEALPDPGEALAAESRHFPAKRLVLDVDERLLDRAGEASLEKLAEARRQGFRLALDHAGSGHATVETIGRVRPDFVKIHRTLVQGIADDLLRQDVARTLVEQARAVGATVVAPGIETREEAEAARKCGVILGQGFHLARPAPPRNPRPQGHTAGKPAV